eukprot:TRINITY_DN815_c0_g2_i11.p1 TRINITY_DN815_c0_g2~~TRINITY_DN815_c0_g2_i11.p1  ORF type:complete len:113 (-),score=37.82 TRINITY_DN815_c0_g2_i11:248-586(-)
MCIRDRYQRRVHGAVLMRNNYSLFAILGTQLMTSIGALIGGIVGFSFGELGKEYFLGFTAGSFLYLSLSQLIPEIRETRTNKSFFSSVAEFIIMGGGIVFMYVFALYEQITQ